MVTWVIESNVFSEKCFDRMIKHFKENSINYHVVRIIPFIHEIEGKVPVISENEKVVVYGSIGIHKLAKTHNWHPGVFFDEDNFKYTSYVEHLGNTMLNHDAVVMRMTEVYDYVKDKYDEFFIKPDSDNKEFAGTVIETSEFQKWYQNMLDIGYLTDNDFDVVISSPKRIGREWRIVVVNNEIADYSLYRQYQMVKPERSITDEVRIFVNEIAQKFSPADVYVIDVVETDDKLKVIEYNTFNSAGLYECNVENIINEVNAFVENA